MTEDEIVQEACHAIDDALAVLKWLRRGRLDVAVGLAEVAQLRLHSIVREALAIEADR